MGQSPSSLGSKSGRSRRSLRSFTRRSKLNKSNLSHTFSMPPSDEYQELMNVNTATEEQLMTLPGVSRQLAKEIVRHRQIIGRFKRVDDLALVSGIGAEKLERLRPEICTNTRRDLSRASSCTQSLDSMRISNDSRLCSVNSASVFQLQCIPGLNQEIAANIVDYRNKKGPFKSLDDLVKVRGMDIIRLSTIKHHLSLEPRKCESVQVINSHTNGWTTDQSSMDSFNCSNQHKSPHRKSLSMPTKFPMVNLPNGFANAPVNDILDLLSAYSHRPTLEEDFRYERNGVRCCRIGTWDIHQLSLEKIYNPGVREVVCRTVLENKISLLAVQDIIDEVSLKIICDELNAPVLKRVKQWKSNSMRWDYCLASSENGKRLGFIFDTLNKNISVECISLEEMMLADVISKTMLIDSLNKLQDYDTPFCFQSQAFLICDKPVLLVNALCERSITEEVTSRIQQVLLLAEKMSIQIAVMGEFFNYDNVSALTCSSRPLLDETKQTTLDFNTKGRSNILTSNLETSEFSGTIGVVKSGLSHLAIPRGWSWGGPASPYCPVWAEFNIPD